MPKRWDHFLANPRSLHRASLALVVLCAVVAIASTLLRQRTGSSSTYLLDVLALLMAVASAWLDARHASFVGDFVPQQIRRGSLLRLLIGLAAMLGGCVAASIEFDRQGASAIEAIGYGLLFAGVALGLGGLLRLLAVQGANYAAAKVQERLDDDY